MAPEKEASVCGFEVILANENGGDRKLEEEAVDVVEDAQEGMAVDKRGEFLLFDSVID